MSTDLEPLWDIIEANIAFIKLQLYSNFARILLNESCVTPYEVLAIKILKIQTVKTKHLNQCKHKVVSGWPV